MTNATNLARTPTELPGGHLLGPHGSGRETAEVEVTDENRDELNALAESGRIALVDAAGRRRGPKPDEENA